jgi:uncharacterized membrane protein (UPF0127 family)
MSRRIWLAAGTIFAAIVAVFLQVDPQGTAFAQNEAMVLADDPAPLIADTKAGKRSFTVEIADDAGERERGLMLRQRMDDRHGMLFVFEATQPVGFWMKNTSQPLDLVFIDQDGAVSAVRHGEPMSEAIISPDEPVRFVLELNAGTAEKAGIETGVRFHHPVIDKVTGASE